MVISKMRCERCKKWKTVRSAVRYRGERYCGNCYKNVTGRMWGGCSIKLEDAEKKLRNVKSYTHFKKTVLKDGVESFTYQRSKYVHLNSCYKGKKVMFVNEEGEIYEGMFKDVVTNIRPGGYIACYCYLPADFEWVKVRVVVVGEAGE